MQWRCWDPWYEVHARGITLEWADLGDERGQIHRRTSDGATTITLHFQLSYLEASAVLTHELVHDERGILFDADTPVDVFEAEEALVRAKTARRLVPPILLLARLRDAVVRAEPISVDVVAEWFSVPASTAREALRLVEEAGDALRPVDLIPSEVVDAATMALVA